MSRQVISVVPHWQKRKHRHTADTLDLLVLLNGPLTGAELELVNDELERCEAGYLTRAGDSRDRFRLRDVSAAQVKTSLEVLRIQLNDLEAAMTRLAHSNERIEAVIDEAIRQALGPSNGEE